MKCERNIFDHCQNRNELCIICEKENQFIQRPNTKNVTIDRQELEQLKQDARLGKYIRVLYSRTGSDKSYIEKLEQWAEEQERIEKQEEKA